MKYENIILDMQEQIRALEKQVERLQQELAAMRKSEDVQDGASATASDSAASPPPQAAEPAPRRKNGKVNEKMLDACYAAAKEYSADERWTVPTLADRVSGKTGMNRNNAFMTILVAYALLNGEVYKRTISGNATEYFFGKILADRGQGGLARAIGATRAHINYRRKLHHNVDKLERLCAQYEKQL